MTKELPVKEHIQRLLAGEAEELPCDDCEISQVDMELPPWFDEDYFKRGQKYMFRNMLGQFSVSLSGLICVLSIPSILTILIKSQKSSSLMGAYRRYMSTIKHVYLWYGDELKPGSVMWKSLITVRMRHLRSSKASKLNGGGHISQRDLALTQFGFFGLGLLRPNLLGMEHDNQEDLKGYVHFWRTIGYMLGIDDRYNLCRSSVEETKEVTQFVCDEVYRPLLTNPPEYFYHMVVELIDAIWYVNTNVSRKPFLYFTYRLVGVPGFVIPGSGDLALHSKSNKIQDPLIASRFLTSMTSEDNKLIPEKFYSKFVWFERFTLNFMVRIYESWMHTYIGRLYYNISTKMTMFFAHYFPFLGFWQFGLKKSFVNIFADDISLPGVLRTNKEVLNTLHFEM